MGHLPRGPASLASNTFWDLGNNFNQTLVSNYKKNASVQAQ